MRDSPTKHHSPLSPTPPNDVGSSPESRRRASSAASAVSSAPYDTVPVSGSSPEPAPSSSNRSASKDKSPEMETPDAANGNVVSAGKKPAWNIPLNGAVEGAPIMGAASWPALSESTRQIPKSSSPESSSSQSKGHVASETQEKQAKTNENPSSSSNNSHQLRQRSTRRGGGGTANSFRPTSPPPPIPPQFPLFEIPFGNLVPPVVESPTRGPPPFRGSNSTWANRPMGGIGSISQPMGEHSSNRNPPSHRRGSFGSRPRGDVVHVNGYIGRRESNREWRNPRSTNMRDVYAAHQVAPPSMPPPPPPPPPRGFYLPPSLPGSAPYLIPHPIGPFGNPIGFNTGPPYLYATPPSMEPFRGSPLLPHPAPLYFPFVDPALPAMIVSQIEYYFSDDNLARDRYLRSRMDDEGWVPISLIAGFPRVEDLTRDIQFILDSLRASAVLEIQGDNVRRRFDWRRWLPSPNAGSQSPREPPGGILINSLQNLAFNDAVADQNGPFDHAEALQGDSLSSSEINDQPSLANGQIVKAASPSHV